MIRTRSRLLASLGAVVLLAGCGSSTEAPTSPSSQNTSAAATGAVIEGTVTGSGGQSVAGPTGSNGTSATGGFRTMATSPMAGMTVRVVDTNLTTTVGETGTFRLADVPGGRVRLQFSNASVNATLELTSVSGEQFIQIQVQLSPTTAVLVNEARDRKVTLCHAEGNGSYHSISISESAEATHRAHGDAMVGEPVPGQPSMTFDENCRPSGPRVEIEKLTNGEDADDAPGPTIVVGAAVTWEYRVTNTGTINLTGIVVSDDKGVAVSCGGVTTLAPGAAMTCTGTGTATLGQYANVGSVTANWTSAAGSGTVSDSDPSHYLGISPEAEDEGPKVTLCHRTGAGFFVRIDVSVSAEPAHLAHGDGRPGGAVPSQAGRVFTATCGVQ